MDDRLPIEAVLLDVGGTLLHEHPTRAAIYAEAARQRGLAVEDRFMRDLMHRTVRELPRSIDGAFRYSEAWFRHFVGRIFRDRLGLPADRLPDLEEELLARFADPATFRLYPGALEMLSAFRGRELVVGIVSNWSERLPDILRGLRVAERVDFILCSSIERCEKPEPAIFRRALSRAGGRPDRTVHAGNDLVLDVRGALDAGILAVPVDHGRRGSWPADLEPVGDLYELERWILDRAR
jgi:putative hydrolase of the HAD superfamily